VAGAAARAARPPERHPLLEELMSAALRVLIAVDGSDNALAAARCWSAWHCADAQALHAVLLAVAPPLPHPWPGTGAEPGSSVESAPTGMGERQLESAREAFARTRLSWEAAVRIGAPAAVLVDEAQRQRADLLVLGTRGLTPLRGLLFGSVALRVAQSSAVPVWLMPPQAPCPQALGRRLRLLVAVDGSDASNAAAAWVARAASRFGDVHIELLSVQPPFSLVEGMIDAAAGQFDHWSQRVGRDAIDAARGAMGETTARIEADVRTGETVETIAARADEIGADAIVVGPRGLGAVGQALLGSVTSGLLQTSRRTVIVVPSATRGDPSPQSEQRSPPHAP
jgi:nucleotide-binding universal stress UspA family protein